MTPAVVRLPEPRGEHRPIWTVTGRTDHNGACREVAQLADADGRAEHLVRSVVSNRWCTWIAPGSDAERPSESLAVMVNGKSPAGRANWSSTDTIRPGPVGIICAPGYARDP